MTEYHNPENVPDSAIPEGWMFIPKDKFPLRKKQPCRSWSCDAFFYEDEDFDGNCPEFTYIIKK